MIPKIFPTRRIRSLHRWLGLFFGIFVFTSAGSGVIHTIMSRTTPPPPTAKPNSGSLSIGEIRVSVPEAVSIAKLDSKAVRSMNLRQIGGHPWYQIYVDGTDKPIYVSASAGTTDDTMDEAYAAEIASRHLGIESRVSTAFLTRFDGEYGPIFRILPVYRFDSGDSRGTRAYVSTSTGSVTLATDDSKAAEARLFSMVHKWMFIRNKDLRDLALSTATFGIMAASAAGVALFILTRPRKLNRQPAMTESRSIGN